MLEVRQARPTEWTEVAEWMHQDDPDDERPTNVLNRLTAWAENPRHAEGLWIARDPRLVGSLQVSPLGGGALLVQPPTGRDDVDNALLTAMLNWAEKQRFRLAHSLTAKPREAEVLARHGFDAVTHLLYLQHPLFPMPDPSPIALRLETYPEADRAVFHDVLERTYQGSLDAPELNGIRSIDEVLAGHRQEGRDRPELWWLAWHEERPVGVVILTQLPEGIIWNLSYLGIVPESRGRGLGLALGLAAVSRAHDEGALELWNSVDERNKPARRLYAKLGFQQSDRRRVMLKIL